MELRVFITVHNGEMVYEELNLGVINFFLLNLVIFFINCFAASSLLLRIKFSDCRPFFRES